MVPLPPNQALGVAIMSYNGRIDFGLSGDYDAMPDLDALASDLRGSLADLAETAGRRAGAGTGAGTPGEPQRASPRAVTARSPRPPPSPSDGT